MEIGGDHLDDQLKNLKLNGSDELSAINEIGDYWTEKPPKKHIHVLVEPPASTVTSHSEQELLDQVASLQALLNKSVHGTFFSEARHGNLPRNLGDLRSLKSSDYETVSSELS